MGSCVSTRSKISPELMKIIEEVFNEMDTDKNKCIDVNETLKFWSKNYPKISTRAMFNAVDTDKNNKIDMKEWKNFWFKVKGTGLSDEEIQRELISIRNKESWPGFKDIPVSRDPNID
jgi:Ca2+-binding EF-hand superfamily protein